VGMSVLFRGTDDPFHGMRGPLRGTDGPLREAAARSAERTTRSAERSAHSGMAEPPGTACHFQIRDYLLASMSSYVYHCESVKTLMDGFERPGAGGVPARQGGSPRGSSLT